MTDQAENADVLEYAKKVVISLVSSPHYPREFKLN